MAKIIKFPIKPAGKFELKPARLRKIQKLEELGQLNLFKKPHGAKIVSFHNREAIFERATRLHDGDPHLAIELYLHSIEKNEHIADSYCNMGILKSEAGDNTDAIINFTKALEQEPGHFESQFNLANIYADAGNHQLAELHYKVAAEIEPEEFNVYYNLALVQALQEKYSESLSSLNKYFDLKSNSVEDREAEKLLILLQNADMSAQ